MYEIDFKHPVRVFFVGIGGISMSGLARILASEGFSVSGSDRSASAITRALEADGICVYIGQRAENIGGDIDLAVFTAAIHPDNPEYQAVMQRGIPSLTRAELLGQLMKNYRLPVAVSGTHGKTTTTSMLSEILLAANADPTLSIGGVLPSIGGNVRIGSGDSFVAEACEYTDSFLHLFPKIGIILNVEEDHLDYFKDLGAIRASFRKFAQLLPADGTLILNAGIDDWPALTRGLSCDVVTYCSPSAGPGNENPCAEKSCAEDPCAENSCAEDPCAEKPCADNPCADNPCADNPAGPDPAASGSASPSGGPADYFATGIEYDSLGHPSFVLHGPAQYGGPVQIQLSVPGLHNVGNALAAVAAADRMGVSRAACAEGLAAFTGTNRRFQYRGEVNGFTIIDDYAHHPTEIEATLHAAAACPHERIVCVFQPHTYSRTKSLLAGFARALSLADLVILTDIYAARETDTLGVSAQTLQEEIRRLGRECLYFSDFAEIRKFLLANCRKGDLVITMGAGNVDQIGTDLLS